jgi:hypothetical protein
MSQFYSNLSSTASSLLERFGQGVTFERESGSAYDPATSQVLTTTESFIANAAAFKFNIENIDYANVLATDLKLIVESNGTYVPQEGDVATIALKKYSVVAVSPLSPAGVPVTFSCQLRIGGKDSSR